MNYISEAIGGVVLLTVVFFGFIKLMDEYFKLTKGTDNANGTVQHDDRGPATGDEPRKPD